LIHSKDLCESDRQKFQDEASKQKQILSSLEARATRLERLREENSALLDEMSRNAERFLQAITVAEDDEREIERIREKAASNQETVKQSEEVIDGILRDVRRSLDDIRRR